MLVVRARKRGIYQDCQMLQVFTIRSPTNPSCPSHPLVCCITKTTRWADPERRSRRETICDERHTLYITMIPTTSDGMSRNDEVLYPPLRVATCMHFVRERLLRTVRNKTSEYGHRTHMLRKVGRCIGTSRANARICQIKVREIWEFCSHIVDEGWVQAFNTQL